MIKRRFILAILVIVHHICLFPEIRTDDYTYYLLGNRMSKWTAEIDCNLLHKGQTSIATIPNNDVADVIGDAVRLIF